MSDPIRVTGNPYTNSSGIVVDTPYEEKKGVQVEDFLQLMIAQLTNQDFMNPVDDTQYVTQLAQFATMQSMQELSHFSQINYVSGLIGKTVTVASLGLGGQVSKVTAPVTKINMSSEEYTLTVGGKEYKLNQIMSLDHSDTDVTKNELSSVNDIVLRTTGTTEDSIAIAWDPPLIEEEKLKNVSYDVYYAKADSKLDFATLSDVTKGTRAAQNLKDLNCVVKGLDAGETYYVNVVVRNQNGDEAIYQHTVQKTKT